jgi:hypothetical protein
MPAGRVHGYQVEISNEASGHSGGVYDEARRGWLHNIEKDPVASKAFKDNEWNKYRVVAIGDSIKTWVNGVPCTDLIDSMDLTGFIALQVHSYKGDKPAQVRWRNIRLQDYGRHEWRPLFDGKTLKGWSRVGGADFKVEDGAIRAMTSPSDERPGLLVSDESFQDVTARVRFRMLKGNSGFFVRADRKTMAGYEVEIDDAKGTGGYWEVGGRRWVTGPEDNAGVDPSGWNELTASFRGNRVTFHLNGIKTIDIPNDPGTLDGHIALQSHGAKRPTEIWFKDIAVLEPAK